MKFHIDQLPIYFPYDTIYPEQYDYMIEVYKTIVSSSTGNKNENVASAALLEMPNGTGRITCLLSLLISYIIHQRNNDDNHDNNTNESRTKLIYCTRSVTEMEKVLEECKFIYEYIRNCVKNEMHDEHDYFTNPEHAAQLVAIGLSSRKNLCINPAVPIDYDSTRADSMCRSITASWIREAALQDSSVNVCKYYQGYERQASTFKLPNGVYTMKDLNIKGRDMGICPYFTARNAVQYADIIVYCYSYLLDPKISSIVSQHLSKESIVVFDEAQTIDIACTESYSVYVNQSILKQASVGLSRLNDEIQATRSSEYGQQRLRAEYERLAAGLDSHVDQTDELSAPPVRLSDVPKSPMLLPGNIRKPEHFWVLMRRFFEYIHSQMNMERDKQRFIGESAQAFLSGGYQRALLDAQTLRFCSARLNSLLNSLQINNTFEYRGLRVLADLATLLGTYTDGFYVTIDPYDERIATVFDPVLQLTCLDSSIAIKPVVDRFKSIIITSGALSPVTMYSKLLQITPLTSRSFPFTYPRSCICPVVMTRGSDQVAVSTRHRTRLDPSVVRNYGALLVELARHVPDGIVAFFTSFQYMEEILDRWNDMDLLTTIRRHKLLVVETTNPKETAIALDNYRKACDTGKGAVFLCVARGTVAESIDFDGQYGRAVVMYGIPFLNTDTKLMRAKLDFLSSRKFRIPPEEYLTFDAFRFVSHCISKILHNKTDYGIAVLADRRYNQEEKRKLFPKWIQEQLVNEHLNLSTETLMRICRKFLKDITQPIDANDIQRFTERDLRILQKKKSAAAAGQQQPHNLQD